MKILDYETAKKVVVKNHYSGRMPPYQLALGFYIKDRLNCVILFGPSATAKMTDSLPSSNYWELSRLFSFDWGSKNIESICISKALKYIEKNCNKDIIVSFADPSENHVGYIYQATNWLYCGLSLKTGGYTYFFDNKWQHPRSTVAKYGTRKHADILKIEPDVKFKRIPQKHRYIYLLGSKKKKKELRKKLKYKILPYPKLNASEAGEVSRVTRIASSDEGLVRLQQPASGALGWFSNLQQANWPTEILLLDFETFFSKDYHLGNDKTAISIPEYVADPRFEFTGLGFQVFNHPLYYSGPTFIPGPSVEWAIERLQKHFGKALHNCTVVAKNNKFDMLILAEKFGIYPAYPLDIEDLSRYLDSRMKHDLGSLAKLFKLPNKGDTGQFKGQHWVASWLTSGNKVPDRRLCSGDSRPPDKPLKDMDHAVMKEYCLNDIRLEAALLKKLLPIIDNPEFEFTLMRHTLNLFLKPKLKLDYELAEQLANDMELEVDRTVESVKKYWPPNTGEAEVSRVLRTRKEFPAMLQRLLGDEPLPMKQGKKEMIPALAKTDEACQALLVHKKENIRDLVAAKLGMTTWPKHAKRVRKMIIQTQCSGDMLRVPLKYYGCHTGRWSGSGGINLHNLGGKGRGKPIHLLIAKVRNCLLAPPGYILSITDSRQIEARVLAWIAECDKLVKGFANKEDIYSEFATGLFGHRVWNPSEKEEKTPESKLAGIERGFGKDGILGCGYGLGSNTFYQRCRENDSLRPMFDSGKYDWDFINKLIKTYRKTYSEIPKFWTNIEKAFRWVTKYPDQKAEVFKGKIKVWMQHGTLCCRLPSDRVLYYRHMSVNTKGDLKYLHGHLWGGSITENVVQAISRDLLGYWVLEFEKTGIPIVLTSHDEAVGCVLKSGAEDKLEQMLDIMRVGPAWAEGLPLDAEGYLSGFYKK